MVKSVTLGLIGDELKNLGKTAGKQIAGTPGDLAKTAGQQIQPKAPQNIENSVEKSAEHPGEAKAETPSDQAEFLKGLYGPTEKKDAKEKPQSKETEKLLEHNKDKTPEEQQKLMSLRGQLHKEQYYDPTFNRKAPLRPEEEQQKQETAAERMERLEMKDLDEKKKKEEKKKPIAVINAETSRERKNAGAG